MKKILVTGGSGFIGSHTIVDLVENGFDVISIDNNSRSNSRMLEGVHKITGKAIKNYKVDLCNYDDTFAVFQENENIAGIIHFAAFKSVGESVEHPLMYFENNLLSLINLLKCVQDFLLPAQYMVMQMKFRLQKIRLQSLQNRRMVTQNKWESKLLMSLPKQQRQN